MDFKKIALLGFISWFHKFARQFHVERIKEVMYSVNLVIKKNYVHEDGLTPIYLQYNFSRETRKLIQTGKRVQPRKWDALNERVRRGAEESDDVNRYIAQLKRKLERIIDDSIIKGIVPTTEYVESELFNSIGVASVPIKLLLHHFSEYIERKKTQVSKDVIKDYLSLKKHLTGFEEHFHVKLTFKTLNHEFYESFVNYLEYIAVKPNGEIGMQKNTVGKLIKNLKAFLNDCMRKNLIERIDISSFKKPSAIVDDVYLTEEELTALETLDLASDIRLNKIRDLFLIGCETGLRFSDLNRLDWQHVQGRFIRIKVKKTTSSVIIPISTRVQRILSNYQRPDFPSGISMSEFNAEMKRIGEKAGLFTKFSKWKVVGMNKQEITKFKYEFISSHTCRRTFCTNQFLKGMPTILIRKISGHKDESAFLRYIKIDEEEAANKLLELWEAERI